MARKERPEGHRQVSLWVPDDLHYQISVFKAESRFNSLETAIIHVLRQSFPEKSLPPKPSSST